MATDRMDSVTHPDEGVLQGYLDGELDSPSRDETCLHLEGCQRCSESLAELRELSDATSGALSPLAIATPELRAAELRTAHEAHRRARMRLLGIPFPSQPWLRAAAVLVVALGVTAAALPGSPVRGWLGTGWQLVSGTPSTDVELTGTTGESLATPSATEAGVRVGAVDGEVLVVLRDLEPGTEFEVLLVDGGQVGVFAGPGSVFSSRSGVVEVRSPTEEVRIELPRGLARATVEVNGAVYLRKIDGRLELIGAAEDSTASTVRFRVAGPPEWLRP